MKKRVAVKHLTPGTYCGEDIYINKHLILSQGVKLTDASIEKLVSQGIPSILIDIPDKEAQRFSDKPLEEPADESVQTTSMSYTERLRASKEFKDFQEEYTQTVFQLTNTLNDIVNKNKSVKIEEMFTPAMNNLIKNTNKSRVFDILSNMKHYDDATYEHCLNVALLSNILATWLKFSDEDVKLATACGLMHDIGKMTIPEEIVKKPGKLTEQEFNIIKMHTVNGFNILKKANMSHDIQQAALSHHEKYDGSGYPLCLEGNDINRFGRLVAIADVYDAMTAERVYRGSLCPFKVISIFEEEGLQKYDPEYILTFLERVVDTYINNNVRLSDGRIGTIVFVNHTKLSLPMISIDGKIVDLSKENGITIEEIL